MQLNYITFFVRDIDKSVEFYEKLVGLKVVRKIETPAGKIVFVQNNDGETMLELIQFEANEKVSAKGLVFSFKATEPLEKIRKRALDMGYETTEITSMPPKPDYFTVVNPDGLIIEFS